MFLFINTFTRDHCFLINLLTEVIGQAATLSALLQTIFVLQQLQMIKLSSSMVMHKLILHSSMHKICLVMVKLKLRLTFNASMTINDHKK